MVILFAPELEIKIDVYKSLKMAVIHDLVEAEAYDIPAFEKERKEEKKKVEQAAALKYKKILNNPVGEEIYNLWQEYEECSSPEARFVKALDKLEVRLQHNEADISTWNEIEYPRSQFAADNYTQIDRFISELNEEIKSESRAKIEASGKDIAEVLALAQSLKNSENSH